MKYDFTICIPTFNRGERALSLVKILLDNLQENWSILVLNNSSTVETEFYEQIESISKVDSRLEYKKHNINIQFRGNYLACFQYSKSNYIMILSDEDFVNFSEIDSILNEIKNDKNLGIYRGSISKHKDLKHSINSVELPNNYFNFGKEAMYGFAFVNNYISGTIYNRELIEKYNLIQTLELNIDKSIAYPHIYFELLISAKCNVKMSSKVVALEGAPIAATEDTGKEVVIDIANATYGIGGRINQFFELRNGIIDATNFLENISSEEKLLIFINLYLQLVDKYFYLIGMCNIDSYKSCFAEESLLKEAFFYICASGIFAYPQIEPYKEIILNGLNEIYQRYK